MYNPARRLADRENLPLAGNFVNAVCLWLVAVGTLFAQEVKPAPLPEAPGTSSQPSSSPARSNAVVFHRKVFWSLVAVDAASAVADTQISHAGLQTCPNYREGNSWLYGPRPSLGRYYATDVVIDGGGALLSYWLLHSRHKPIRVFGWLPLAVTLGSHGEGVVRWANAIGSDCGNSR